MKNKLKEAVTPTYENIFKVIKAFFKCFGLLDLIQCDINPGDSLNYNKTLNKWQNVPNIDNSINILARNQKDHFQRAHGTVNVGNKIFIGVRYSLTETHIPRLVYYPDCNDLQTYQYVEFKGLSPDNNIRGGIETMCYDEVTHKIYCPLQNTNKIVAANADNIYDHQIININLPVGELFTGSGSILTDNEYLYVVTEVDNLIVKIRISDFSVVATNYWVENTVGAHNGQLNTDNKEYAYFSNSGKHVMILKLSDLSYINIEINFLPAMSDDLIFIPENTALGTPPLLMFPGEFQDFRINGLLIDLSNNTPYNFPMFGSYGTFFDREKRLFISCMMDGGIETINVDELYFNLLTHKNINDIVKTYFFKGKYFLPNEFFITPSGYFCTFWECDDDLGRLAKIELIDAYNPVVTKKEIIDKYSDQSKYNFFYLTNNVDYKINNIPLLMNSILIANTTTNININIPPVEEQAFPIGSLFKVLIKGNGTVTFTGTNTISSISGGNVFSQNNALLEVIKLTNNEWLVNKT